jgi:hypothetical protein
MVVVRCSLAYHQTLTGKLDTFAVGVRDGIYGHPAEFVAPTVLELDFNAAITAYIDTYGAYAQGGNAQKGPYFAAEETLMGMLDENATYVDSVAQGNANLIWLSGFKPTKGTSSKRPAPEQFQEVEVTRGSTGVLFAECESQKVVDVYVCIVAVGGPMPDGVNINLGGQLPIGENAPPIPVDPENPTEVVQPLTQTDGAILDFNKKRKKKFLGLTPGVTYYFTFFGINSSGVGQFSEPVSLMCW